jgi:energy-converting hydrogenase A subunit M
LIVNLERRSTCFQIITRPTINIKYLISINLLKILSSFRIQCLIIHLNYDLPVLIPDYLLTPCILQVHIRCELLHSRRYKAPLYARLAYSDRCRVEEVAAVVIEELAVVELSEGHCRDVRAEGRCAGRQVDLGARDHDVCVVRVVKEDLIVIGGESVEGEVGVSEDKFEV